MAKQGKPGDVISIVIDGKKFDTVIDSSGVQRLPDNTHLNVVFYQGLLDLNALAIKANQNPAVKRARRWVYENIGYSVCGFAEIYPKAKIENPLWEE